MLSEKNEKKLAELNAELEKDYKIKIGKQNCLNAMFEFCVRPENIVFAKKYIGVVRVSDMKQRRINRLQKDLKEIDDKTGV